MAGEQFALGDTIRTLRSLRDKPPERELVVISAAEFERLKPRRDFIEHLMSGPSFEGLDLDRDASSGRDIEFDDPA